MKDFVMDKSGAEAGFLRKLRFPLPIYIPSASPQSSSLSPEAGTIGQEWLQCQWPHKPNKKNCVSRTAVLHECRQTNGKNWCKKRLSGTVSKKNKVPILIIEKAVEHT
jgi:hypothetical protein